MSGVTDAERLNFPVFGSSEGEEVCLSESDLFSSLAHQSCVKNHHYETFFPETGSLLEVSPDVTFTIPPSLHLTSLADSFYEVHISLCKGATKEKVVAADKAVPTNFVGVSWIKNLATFVNGKPANSNFGLFHLEAYLKLVTETSSDAIHKHAISGFYPQKIQTQLG